jgi:hypothetical protein
MAESSLYIHLRIKESLPWRPQLINADIPPADPLLAFHLQAKAFRQGRDPASG